ncbi:MAG: Ppx/GppA phosphatase family protein [Microlunatus sp.]
MSATPAGRQERQGDFGRVGAVDCGTNSIRLLIAEARSGGGLSEVARELEIVRLGQGVDATGELHPDALARTFAAAERYGERLRSHGVGPEQTRVVATSAARDARNVADFYAGMTARLGVRPEIVSGAEEARLSFTGALSGVPVADAGPVLVMDIGGGSTELVLGDAAGQIDRAVSLNIGSVRLTERFGRVVGVQQDAAAYVDGLLDGLGWPAGLLGRVGTWIGVAGTVTTMSALQQGLTTYDRSTVHGSVLSTDQISSLAARLAMLTTEEIRGLGVPAGRADVIPAGALIADRVARRVGRPMIVSESDILDGIALSLLPG